MKTRKPSQLIYLDHAATTAVDPRVLKTMQPYWAEKFANPAALYGPGREAASAMNAARAHIAEILHCQPKEIIFTAGGTESNNLAILGMAKAWQKKFGQAGHIITSPIEHHSVLYVARALKQWGWKVSFTPVDKTGLVDFAALKKLVRKDSALISIMYANNEIGSIQPITEIGKWVRGLNKARASKGLQPILFHTDACQAGGALSLDTQELRVDLLTLNGSKIYGPKQTGLLFVRSGVELEPLLEGGGQERNLRSGTENVPGIVGLAAALALVQKDRSKENKRLSVLQKYFVGRLSKKVKDFWLNGPLVASGQRLPNNLNIGFKNIEGESLMIYLDAKRIAVATGSACAEASLDPSHVLLAIGQSPQQAESSIRLSFGHSTTKQSLDKTIQALTQLVPKLRRVTNQK
jgi:cysteine desulfurase